MNDTSAPDGPLAAPEPAYTIGELAKEFGITLRAIRFYEDRQLLHPERQGQLRLFSRTDRARLALICRGKRLGFSLRDIGAFLDLYEVDNPHLEQMTFFLEKANARIKQLEGQRQDIDQTLEELHAVANHITKSIQGLKDGSLRPDQLRRSTP